MSVVIESQMLIRASINIVFNAFVDPLITTQFWFSHSTGYVEKKARFLNGAGKSIRRRLRCMY